MKDKAPQPPRETEEAPASPQNEDAPPPSAYTPEEKEIVIAKLKSLGYM